MKRHTENEPYESPNKKRRIDSYEQVHMISSSEPASQVWTLGDDLPTTKTLSAFSDAEIYAAALWSLKAGKKDIAFAILNVASERGIAQAQFLLGVYYLDTKDFKKVRTSLFSFHFVSFVVASLQKVSLLWESAPLFVDRTSKSVISFAIYQY